MHIGLLVVAIGIYRMDQRRRYATLDTFILYSLCAMGFVSVCFVLSTLSTWPRRKWNPSNLYAIEFTAEFWTNKVKKIVSASSTAVL